MGFLKVISLLRHVQGEQAFGSRKARRQAGFVSPKAKLFGKRQDSTGELRGAFVPMDSLASGRPYRAELSSRAAVKVSERMYLDAGCVYSENLKKRAVTCKSLSPATIFASAAGLSFLLLQKHGYQS